MTHIRRVFISHTSEFTKYPEKRSFVDAAIAAVNRAGSAPCDMGYFTARDEKPAAYCKKCVQACDVYVGVIGVRYGSPVRDRPDVSYTELEFEAATEVPNLKRFIFLLDPEASFPLKLFTDMKHGDRQEQFRQRLKDAKVMCASFSNVDELEKLIYQALKEDEEEAGEPKARQVRIDWPEGKSPYPGLFSFDLDYAPLFFGRDRDVDAVLAKLSQAAGRFLVISGASGSGKSSLVAAGIRRAVNDGRLTGGDKMVWLRIQPGRGHTPWESLTWPLIDTFPRIATRSAELATELATRPQTLGRLLDTHLPPGSELLLFVDQLEELFTSGFQDQDMIQFLDVLVTTSRAPNSRLRVIGTVRSEFMGRVQESDLVCEALNGGGSHFLSLISPAALQEMIEKPAQATGYDFEGELVSEIVQDAGHEPGRLPLVAYVMNQLFLQRQDGARTFTRAAYHAIGRVAGAIGTQADRVLKGMDRNVDAAFGRVFAELVHIERGRPPTRKRAGLSHFAQDADALAVIQVLAGPECRVLVTGGEQQGGMVEVAHEQLFSAWRKLEEWIQRSDADLRLIDFEEECATRWQETGSHVRDLWRHEQAAAVQLALARFSKTPSAPLHRRLNPQAILVEQLKDASLSHTDRLLIGQKLVDFGDPRAGVGLKTDGIPDIAWIEIPGGMITLEGGDHVYQVKPFKIATYPVTNAQFAAFLNAEDGVGNDEWWRDLEPQTVAQPTWSEANAPRETVSWYEAIAFCRWLSAKMGKRIRLPTEWEWQQAATGGDPRREYPWDGAWDASRCNSNQSRLNRTTAVGMYPQGVTEQGVLDMAGNLWEWCLNKYENPEQPEAVRIDTVGRRVLRGGSWHNVPEFLRASSRYWNFAVNRTNFIGFRLLQDNL